MRLRPQWVPLEYAQEQIQNAISDVCLSIKAEDYFDLDKPHFVNVEVELPDEAKALYDDMERELFIELANATTVEAANAAAKTVKCLQLANGAIYTDDTHNWQEVHTAKLDALASIVEEAAGEPLLINLRPTLPASWRHSQKPAPSINVRRQSRLLTTARFPCSWCIRQVRAMA